MSPFELFRFHALHPKLGQVIAEGTFWEKARRQFPYPIPPPPELGNGNEVVQMALIFGGGNCAVSPLVETYVTS